LQRERWKEDRNWDGVRKSVSCLGPVA